MYGIVACLVAGKMRTLSGGEMDARGGGSVGVYETTEKRGLGDLFLNLRKLNFLRW